MGPVAKAGHLVLQLRTVLTWCKPDERVAIFDLLMHDYCPHCGSSEDGRICQCTNDE